MFCPVHGMVPDAMAPGFGGPPPMAPGFGAPPPMAPGFGGPPWGGDTFFQKTLSDGFGQMSTFRGDGGLGAHSTTWGNVGPQDHLTFDKPFNGLGYRKDFSLETGVRLNGFNQMGGLEQRSTLLDTYSSSPVWR